MYQTILVPLDGSERAESILPHVEHFAQQQDAKVIFITIVEPITRSAILDITTEENIEFKPQQVYNTKKYLNQLKENFQAKGVTAEIMILRGVAVEAILHAAKEVKADLIALTSQGRTGLKQVFYGSVTSGILNRVRRPLLVAHTETKWDLVTNNRLLVPLDGSKRAEKIIPHVEAVAKLYDAQVVLMQVVSMIQKTTSFEDLDKEFKEEALHDHLFRQVARDQEVARVKKARDYLLSWRDRLRHKGMNVEVKLLHGRPVEGIMQVAEQINADLIMMTSHGRTGLSQVFYGSITSGVLNQVRRPLLLVRPGEKSNVKYF